MLIKFVTCFIYLADLEQIPSLKKEVSFYFNVEKSMEQTPHLCLDF